MMAFDFGAGSGRAVLGRLEGGKLDLEEIHRFPNEAIAVGESLHWDILRIYQESKVSLKKYFAEYGPDLDSIGFDTWAVDYALLGKNGEVLGMPHHYRDERNEGMMDETFKLIPKRTIYDITGIQFIKFNTLYQLLAEKKTTNLLEITDKVLSIAGLFHYFFTGKKIDEYSIITHTQFYDIRKKTWSKKILDACGIPWSIMPELAFPGDTIGTLKADLVKETQVSECPVIAVSCHDTGSAVLGTPGKGNDWAFLSSGTWSLLGTENTIPVISDESFKSSFTNEGGAFGTYRFLKNITGLWLIQECARFWKESFGEIASMAEKSKPFQAVINPDADCFWAPQKMEDEIHSFIKETGQEIQTKIGDLARVIFESLALKSRYMLDIVKNSRYFILSVAEQKINFSASLPQTPQAFASSPARMKRQPPGIS